MKISTTQSGGLLITDRTTFIQSSVFMGQLRPLIDWLSVIVSDTILLPQILTTAPKVDSSAAENSSQQKHYFLLFV